MSDKTEHMPSQDLSRLMESARRLGVELKEAEALQWLTAMAATQSGGDIVVDVKDGVLKVNLPRLYEIYSIQRNKEI